MKLSIITDEFTQNLSEAISFAKEYKLDALELRTIDNLPIEQLSEKRLHEIGYAVQEAGLVICNLSGSFGKCFFRDRTGEKEKLEKLIKAARILNVPSIRGFGFFSEDGPTREQAASALIEPAKRLEQEGISLLLEADPSVTTTNHRALRRLITTINRPNVGAIYDPGNDIWDPLGECPYPDGWFEIKQLTRHIHIKDGKRTMYGPIAVKVGTGHVGLEALLKEVKDFGYDGYLSLECHYRVGGELSEEQMKRPGGAAFSDGGLMACKESMKALRKMLENI